VVQVTSADLSSGKPLEALNGKTLSVTKEGGVRKNTMTCIYTYTYKYKNIV
jgi:hypothetical protein